MSAREFHGDACAHYDNGKGRCVDCKARLYEGVAYRIVTGQIVKGNYLVEFWNGKRKWLSRDFVEGRR